MDQEAKEFVDKVSKMDGKAITLAVMEATIEALSETDKARKDDALQRLAALRFASICIMDKELRAMGL